MESYDHLNPLNFREWIEEHREFLKPPVCNKLVWTNRDFMVTVVGGPNSRTDFHINEGEEFFYQIEGNMLLRIRDRDNFKDISIREGDIFLLPPRIPHSPQRPPNSVGLVLERKRLPHEKDAFVWYCDSCGNQLYIESFHLTDIVSQLPPVFERYYSDPSHSKCKKCNHDSKTN